MRRAQEIIVIGGSAGSYDPILAILDALPTHSASALLYHTSKPQIRNTNRKFPDRTTATQRNLYHRQNPDRAQSYIFCTTGLSFAHRA